MGSIGENKLLLITTIKLIDDYFNLKQKINLQKNKLDDLSKKFLEMKALAINYKEKKDSEINKLNLELDKLKTTVEESSTLYESILDKTAKSLEEIIEKTSLNS